MQNFVLHFVHWPTYIFFIMLESGLLILNNMLTLLLTQHDNKSYPKNILLLTWRRNMILHETIPRD